MKHFLRLTDLAYSDIEKIFETADAVAQGGFERILDKKTAVMFFPETSIRTRVSFEKGVHLLGGQTVLFPPEALDKKERIKDVVGYLNNWADLIVVRHKDMSVLEEIAKYAKVPVINALTSVNHPCEMMSDMYALSKKRDDIKKCRFLFMGAKGNIGLAWKEASEAFEFSLEQCCAKGYEIDGLTVNYDIEEAVRGKDVVCTDSLPAEALKDFEGLQITKAVMDKANPDALLNPCPPFYIGEEVSEDAIDSPYFVGYEFKKSLLPVQQAIMIFCLTSEGEAINDYSGFRLETEHLVLKKPVLDDWKALYKNIWSRDESAKYMLWETTKSEEEAEERMKRSVNWQYNNKYAFCVYPKDIGEAVGWAVMCPCGPDAFEITGVALGPDFVRKGYGREILKAFEEAARSEGAVKLISGNRAMNVASRQLQKACGFVFESLSEEKQDPRTGEKYFIENNVKYL